MLYSKSYEVDNEGDTDYGESDISKEELDLSIEKLGCSPMKLVGQRDRVG